LSQVSSKLRRLAEGSGYRLGWWCLGCENIHWVRVAGDGNNWEFNGDLERPTFKPSVLIRSGHYAPFHKPGEDCWCTFNAKHPDRTSFRCVICHTHVIDGRVQYLLDCSHELAGRTIELPDLPPEHRDAPPSP
jgi:hypothetical protein